MSLVVHCCSLLHFWCRIPPVVESNFKFNLILLNSINQSINQSINKTTYTKMTSGEQLK